MQYFKTQDGGVWAYDNGVALEQMRDGLTPMTPEEIAAHLHPVPAPLTPEQQAARIAERRYQAETQGIALDGVFINTERDSQALVTGATVSAMLDSSYVCNWKTPTGFVQLDATALIGIAQSMRAHVQACFYREGELLAALADETFEESMLEEGWPV